MTRWTRGLLLLVLVCACLMAPPAASDPSLTVTPEVLIERGRGGLCGAQLFGEGWVRTELFFGRSRADGTTVTDEEWQQFLDRYVTPRFPDGLTVLMGKGQFRDDSGMILSEDSVLLILLYPLPGKDNSQHIEAIRQDYKDAFEQQSVLRVDRFACVSF